MFSEEEKCLLYMLTKALKNEQICLDEKVNMDNVLLLAKKHAVLSFLYDISNEAWMHQGKSFIQQESRQIVMQSYRLLFLTKYVVNLLKQNEIPVIVLKGVATGSLYPVSEMRKSGDVDLLVPNNIPEAVIRKVMLAAGFRLSEAQHANHHIAFVTEEGIHVEIHTMLAEPFAYKKINRAIAKQGTMCWEHLHVAEIMGVELPILDKPFHAYELLLHMLQHFMYAGFGLKLLCDWVMIWRVNWSQEEKDLFNSLIEEAGLSGFTDAITAVCQKFLGLSTEDNDSLINQTDMADKMLREILDAEEFGNSDSNRMVMMSGTGLSAYVKEFHHQMHLNFPKAGKCILLWPILWIITLVRFLKNNRRLRDTSTGEILKEAKRRSALMEELRLFP